MLEAGIRGANVVFANGPDDFAWDGRFQISRYSRRPMPCVASCAVRARLVLRNQARIGSLITSHLQRRLSVERTIISWNFANWFTVLLMAAAGYAVLALASQVLMKKAPTLPQRDS